MITITHADKVYAHIIDIDDLPSKTTFLTPPELNQQVGYIVRKAGEKVAKHFHVPLERHIVGTSEVLYVLAGACVVDFYDDKQDLVSSFNLRAGHLIVLVAGGHGFTMAEDTVMFEVKQGPYTGLDEKETF